MTIKITSEDQIFEATATVLYCFRRTTDFPRSTVCHRGVEGLVFKTREDRNNQANRFRSLPALWKHPFDPERFKELSESPNLIAESGEIACPISVNRAMRSKVVGTEASHHLGEPW